MINPKIGKQLNMSEQKQIQSEKYEKSELTNIQSEKYNKSEVFGLKNKPTLNRINNYVT